MKQHSPKHVLLIPCLTHAFSLVLLYASPTVSVHATLPMTPSGLHTQVTLSPVPPPAKTRYDITGGTRPAGGVNLYHSFGDFNVPSNTIANFLNSGSVDSRGALLAPNLPTANILGRVTGGNISNIFGTIQTTGFGNANLFLMNPAGFLFGPSAAVNVGGMVAFTSADYLRLVDGAIFNAIPNAAADALLSAAPVAAFGFLGSNPGAISVQGTPLTVANATGISFVGGNITIQSGTPDGGTAQAARLSAPNGKMQLASAASPGEFDAATLQPLPNVNNTSFTSFGSVSLTPGSNINVSGGNTVLIRGGQFVLSVNDAVLSTAQSPGPPQTISLAPGSSILSSNAGADPGADVQLLASNVQLDGASIKSLTTGAGTGGNIWITAVPDGGPTGTAGSLQINGGQIQTATVGPGTVGNIQVHTSSLSMTDGALIDTVLGLNPVMPGQPAGGTIAIMATDSIFVTGQRSDTTNVLPSVAGLSPLPANTPSGIYSLNVSANTGSRIVIETPSLTLRSGLIASRAFGAGPAGDLSLVLGQLTLTDGGAIGSSTFGAGATGGLLLRASDSITMSGSLPGTFQLGSVNLQNVESNIVNVTFGSGQAGPVSISTPTLTMSGAAAISSSSLGSGGAGDVTIQAGTITLTGGATISSSTFFSGSGGNVSVSASEQLSISGHRVELTSFGLETAMNSPSSIGSNTFGTGRAGAITINTPTLTMSDGGVITTATGGDGPAGAITVNAGSMNVSGGASISSSSGLNLGLGTGFQVGNGAGGMVTVNATGPVTIADQGSGLFSSTAGTGAGGNIHLSANSVTLQNGGQISSSSSGTGRAGDITINAGNQLTMTSSAITTEANQSSGGTIAITTNPNGTVQLTDSKISASVLNGAGGGGSVNIDPEFVVLQNSQILAQAVQGPGGNISITTNLLLPDTASVISASSQFGQQGNIAIQSPISPASGKIIPLSQRPLIPTTLLSQRCTALAGGAYSSFIVAGRDSLPAEPTDWLSSPLPLGTVGTISSATTVPRAHMSLNASTRETPILSLRRMMPHGFLTQSFAAQTSRDCTS